MRPKYEPMNQSIATNITFPSIENIIMFSFILFFLKKIIIFLKIHFTGTRLFASLFTVIRFGKECAF